jgi:hypothetical protein
MEPWLEKFARANFRRSADTAHDLKTPLNVAVLNLELLRMRIRKLVESEDEKLVEYTRAIETELRRLGSIFDAFFLLSTPPHNEGDPVNVDLASVLEREASSHGYELERAGPAWICAHESRIRQAGKLFFEGASRLLQDEGREVVVSRDATHYEVSASGPPRAEDAEMTRIFKFYHSGPDGAPDLSLAVARLIVETYGGELSAAEDRDTVALRLTFPLGER